MKIRTVSHCMHCNNNMAITAQPIFFSTRFRLLPIDYGDKFTNFNSEHLPNMAQCPRHLYRGSMGTAQGKPSRPICLMITPVAVDGPKYITTTTAESPHILQAIGERVGIARCFPPTIGARPAGSGSVGTRYQCDFITV
jgi:hypothetical protein